MGLNFKVFFTKRESGTRGAPAGNPDLMWVPTTSTLIYGENDAVLIDTQLTKEATTELLKWVEEAGKNITYIYITHSHGDHFFGNAVILKRFPNAKVIATPEVVKGMAAEVSPERMETVWNMLFPGQIPEITAEAMALKENKFELEGEEVQVLRLGHTDTSDSTSLWVPSIRLVVAGDSVYNNVHPFTAEAFQEKLRNEWIASLDKMAALKPLNVVGGHFDPDKGFGPESIAQTRGYIEQFNSFCANLKTPEEVYSKMLELYPARLNPGSAWSGASAAKNPESIWAIMAAQRAKH